MKKVFIVLLFLLASFCFAQEQDIFNYTPRTKGYLSIDNGFSVQIIPYKNKITYNIFNNLKGCVDIVAWKTDKEYVTIIARLRGWNTDKTAEYFSILIDGRTTKTKANSKLLSQLPDLSDYYINSAWTNDAAINLRSESNVKSNKVGQYQKNNTVIFTKKTENKCSIDDATDYWFSIDYSGIPAWIYGKYITFESSANISLESLRFIKSEKTIKKDFNQTTSLKLNCITGSSKTLYNIYNKDNILIRMENTSYYSHGSINIQKGNKQIADIKSVQYSVYSPKFNKLFYLTYLMDYRSSAYSLDCTSEKGEQLQSIYSSELTPYYSKVFLSNDETKLFAIDSVYSNEDMPSLALIEIDVATNKVLNTYTTSYPPFHICSFGKLNDEIFYFVTNPRIDYEPNIIKFAKIQGNKLTEIASFKFEDYNLVDQYADEVFLIDLQTSNYAIINSHDFRNDKSLIFEYKNENVIECSSKVKGAILSSFYMNDSWYLLSAEKSTGTIYLYDANLNELKTEVYKDYATGYIIFSKVGFDSTGEITVIFENDK